MIAYGRFRGSVVLGVVNGPAVVNRLDTVAFVFVHTLGLLRGESQPVRLYLCKLRSSRGGSSPEPPISGLTQLTSAQ